MNQSKAKSHLIFQGIGLFYVAYLMASLVSDYCNGQSPLPPLLFCLLMAAMAGAELALGWCAWRNWRRDRDREQMEEEKKDSHTGE